MNDKQYVGQTIGTLEQRWKEHTGSNTNSFLHKAIRKYGKDNFLVEKIHECGTKEEMDFVEMFYIALLITKAPNGYNLTDGGEGTIGREPWNKGLIGAQTCWTKGIKMSAEARQNMSLAHKCNISPKKGKEGHKHSEETKNKLREMVLGRKLSDVTKLRSEEHTSELQSL